MCRSAEARASSDCPLSSRLLSAVRYQLLPPPEQVFQLGAHPGVPGFGGRVEGQIKGGTVVGQDLSVQAVGFGLLSAGPGVGAHPVQIGRSTGQMQHTNDGLRALG